MIAQIFFHFKEEEEEEEDEEKDRIKLNVEEDYEFGHLLRTDIIPNAVLWFTGEAVDDEDFDDDDEDDEDDEEGTER